MQNDKTIELNCRLYHGPLKYYQSLSRVIPKRFVVAADANASSLEKKFKKAKHRN